MRGRDKVKQAKITKSFLFAIAIAVAGGCAADVSDDEPQQPQPGNAYLTVVGDVNVFLENGWRQTLTIKYHDGNDQPLAGQIDFAVVGNSRGGTITTPFAVTDANGVATIEVIAGAQEEAAFKIRATADYADAAEWSIAVAEGVGPLPPLDPTGEYNMESDLDMVSGLPGTVGDVVNTFIDITDDAYDPTKWILDQVIAAIDQSWVSDAADAARPALDGFLNDMLLGYAPDFVTTILDVGDKFGQVARKFGVSTTLKVEKTTGVEGDEYKATHTMTGMYFTLDGQRYTFTNTELGLQNQAVSDLTFTLDTNSNVVAIATHKFNLPYGAMLLEALNQIIIPLIDPFASNISELLAGLVNCTRVGEELSSFVGIGSASLYEGACEIGLNVAAGTIEDTIRDLSGMDLNIDGTANAKDTNGDSKVDLIRTGKWTGNVDYFGAIAPLTTATFSGERMTVTQ